MAPNKSHIPYFRRLVAALVLLLPLCMLSTEALAQATQIPAMPQGTCTNDPQFNPPMPAPGSGLVSVVANEVKAALDGFSESLFTYVSGGITRTVSALLTLYVIVYAILFTFGMIKLTLTDFAIRMTKVGLLAVLMSPGAWSFFNNTVVHFFNDGTDSIIAEVTSYILDVTPITDAATSVPGAAATMAYNPTVTTSQPFAVVDYAISQALSARMAVTFAAIIFTGPYGVIIAGILLLAMWRFIEALVSAVWVYLMSLALKTLLFGVAPIFICCLLFQRTRHMFDGWLNQVLNATLQPVLLFVFFAFFAILVGICITNILSTPVCWTEAQESVRGSPFHVHFWRFEILSPTGRYEPYGGTWSFYGPDDASGPVFPISMMSALLLLLISDIAYRFNSVVGMIASELAGGSTSLANFESPVRNWSSPARRGSNITDVRTPTVPGVRGSVGSLAGRRGTPG